VLQAELRSTLLQVEADKAALVDQVKAAEVSWLPSQQNSLAGRIR
jgi:hypothetical protein